MVNGSFMDEFEPPNPYRQLPGPEADAAWDRISESGWFFISSQEVEDLGKDPEKVVKAPVEWGYGEDAHLAALDLNHQIHCINSRTVSNPEKAVVADIWSAQCSVKQLFLSTTIYHEAATISHSIRCIASICYGTG